MAALVSCSKVLLTHDLEDPQPSVTITPHKGTINCSVWSHNNQVIASCGSDGKIILSHAWKGNTLLDLDAENSKAMPVNSVWFTSNSQYLASGGHDGLLKIWDLKKRALGSSHKYHFSSITSVHWNMDDSIVASSSLTGDIVLHSTKFGTQIANFTQKGSQGVKMIKFSPFISNNLASAGIDGSVFVWDINTRQPAVTFLSNHTSRVNAICFSSFNPVLMCSAGLDRTVNFYDIREKKVVKTLQTDSPLTALAFHNDGHTIVAGTLYGGLYVYDLKAAGNVKTYLKGHEDAQVNFLDFIRPESSKVETSLIEEEKPKLASTTSSSNSTHEQLVKKTTGDMGILSNRVLTTEPLSANVPRTSYSKLQQNEPKSALDPNNELSAKFENIEEFKRQALESLNAKKADKTVTNTRLSGNSIQGFATPITGASQLETKSETNPSERGFGSGQSAVKDGIQANKIFGHMSSIQKEPPPEAMNIESSKKLSALNRSIEEVLDKKTNSYITRVDGSQDFTQQQKEFIKDCLKEQKDTFKESLFDLQSNIGESLGNLHLEVIRQFEIQKNEIDAKLERYFTEFNSLFQKNEELRRENERLKKTSY